MDSSLVVLKVGNWLYRKNLEGCILNIFVGYYLVSLFFRI